MTTVYNVSSSDQLPQIGPYDHIMIASATATSSLKNYDAGFVLDDNENTGWKSEGKGESLTILLPKLCIVHRLFIEWDPDLTRTGTFKINFSNSETEMLASVSGQQDTSMFCYVDTEVQCDNITIICNGNYDDDLNGIRTVRVFGNDE